LFRHYKNPKYLTPDAPKPLQLHPFFLIFGAILFWELFLHGLLFAEFNWRILFVIGWSVFFAIAFTILCGFLPRKGNLIVLWIILSVLYLWYSCQLIYFKIFGGFISVYLIQMGGEAVTNFFKETVSCVVDNIGLLLVLALPLAVTGVLLYFKKLRLERRHIIYQGIGVAACVALHCICLLCLPIGGTGAYTIYDVYHNVNTGTDASVASLGFLTTFRLEAKCMLFGTEAGTPGIEDPGNLDDLLGNIPTLPKPTVPRPTVPDETGPIGGTLPNLPTEPPVIYTDQTMQIDFDALLSQAQTNGNSALATLHQYFANQTPTKTNDFTGMFEGKNLIYMVCESFSPVVISPELTPTLYKLYNEGIKFNNFYGTYYNVTTNGEYTACMGVFPDLSRSKKDGSFAFSAKNHVPFTLGNMFQDQLGVNAYGYHNYKGSYYSRNQSHPNMGYACKFMGAGMKFTYGWPSSDLEMMEQSIPDYINEDQFHAYYMTFSGHYAYDFGTNPMCYTNADGVAHLEYSEPVKAYIACHLELEKAMAYLMEQLEAAGKLEDTVIVMTSDHFPYGLTQKQYNELAGEKKDSAFGIYENAFICWSAGLEEPIEIDTPCCTVDILPTLLNLFGFTYDSRLLVGQDVLDPSIEHIAILHNGSFITDKVKFNSSNGKVAYLVDEALVPEGYVEAVTKIVQTRFTVSTAILNNDYYRVVFRPTE
jgi:hypothetical protein